MQDDISDGGKTSSFVSMVRVFGIWIGICPGELELLYVTSY